MEILLAIYKPVLIAFLWCSFTPFTMLLERLKSDYVIVQYLIDNAQCYKCTSFWLTLAFTQDLFCSIIAMICTLILKKMTSSMSKGLKN